MSGNLGFRDNDKIAMGQSSDLQIYHTGSHGFIRNTTGQLSIRDDSEVNISDNSGNIMIKASAGGAIELNHNTSKKLETKSDGIDVIGEVQCDSLDVDGTAHISGDFTFDGGAGAVTIANNSDIRFQSGTWSGEVGGKIQHHDNYLYIQGGSNGWIFRSDAGVNRAVLESGGHFRPGANNSYDLGTSSVRWRNLYTNDLNLCNEGSANDVDGTWGNYTIQEGEDDLFLINRRNGKKYKFNLTEVS